MSGLNPFRRKKSKDLPPQQPVTPANILRASSPTATPALQNSPMSNGAYETNHAIDSPSSDVDPLAPATTTFKSNTFTYSFPSSHTRSHTADSSNTDMSQRSNRLSLERPVAERATLQMDGDSKAFICSAEKQEKPLPPPPRGHGKLVRSSSTIASKRLSFHGTSRETSLFRSDALAQSSNDYRTGLSDENRPIRGTEPLQRSQSQYRRPPTPPLSRRKNQMRRSNTTYAKINPSRHVLHGDVEANAFANTDTMFTASSRPESETSTPVSDEAISQAPSSYGESINHAASMGEGLAVKAARRTSFTNMTLPAATPPPPPPPRRVRRSSINSSGSRRASWFQESMADRQGDFIPHPSNANGILADLSRLQKEVDDLRGHYEGRKASQ